MPMRVIVAVNQVCEISFRQTTALLTASLVRQGCEVYLADVDAFSYLGSKDRNRFFVNALDLAETAGTSNDVESFARSDGLRKPLALQPDDLILIRTNPGRDLHRTSIHETFLDFCRNAVQDGVKVVNDPRNLRFFANKSSLAMIKPAYRPPMIVSHDAEVVADFVRSSGRACVIKPLVGSRGKDVIPANPEQDDLESLIERSFGQRGMVAQHFVSADQPGDTRVVVLDGKILESKGCIAGIARCPADGDFRGNLHAGGTAHPVTLSGSARLAVKHSAHCLKEHGIRLAGVDLVGDKVIEFNVFSTGGLFDASRFAGIDFCDLIVESLLTQPD